MCIAGDVMQWVSRGGGGGAGGSTFVDCKQYDVLMFAVDDMMSNRGSLHVTIGTRMI